MLVIFSLRSSGFYWPDWFHCNLNIKSLFLDQHLDVFLGKHSLIECSRNEVSWMWENKKTVDLMIKIEKNNQGTKLAQMYFLWVIQVVYFHGFQVRSVLFAVLFLEHLRTGRRSNSQNDKGWQMKAWIKIWNNLGLNLINFSHFRVTWVKSRLQLSTLSAVHIKAFCHRVSAAFYKLIAEHIICRRRVSRAVVLDWWFRT